MTAFAAARSSMSRHRLAPVSDGQAEIDAEETHDQSRANRSESSRKVLDVLLLFDERRPEMSVADIAEQCRLPLSTAYRYVSVLRRAGLLLGSERGTYHLGPRLIALARTARMAYGPVLDVALPVMARLCNDVHETVLIIRRVGDTSVCLDRIEPQQAVRLSYQPGQPMSLVAGASAKVLVASLSRDERRRVLDGAGVDRGTGAPFNDEALDDVAARGWAESFGEIDDEIWGVAAPVVNAGVVVAAVSVAGPLYRLDERRRRHVVDATRRAAEEISAAIDATSR